MTTSPVSYIRSGGTLWEQGDNGNTFVDVKQDRFEDTILWAYYSGITTRTGDGTTSSPEHACTRKQIVIFLQKYKGEPAPKNTEITFTDVKNDRFAAAILWVSEQGITTGTGDGTTFGPEAPYRTLNNFCAF